MANEPPKRKSRAVVLIASGAGGMQAVEDKRFVAASWPIKFDIPAEVADAWFQYLDAAGDRRGWANGNLAQHGARGNSGSSTLTGSDSSQLHVVWERKRNGPLQVRANAEGGLSLDDARSFLHQVTYDCRAGRLERIYNQGQLQYTGLPWRGELWLDDALRLGPPSKQYAAARYGPRIIIVDAVIDAVDRRHSTEVFAARLQGLGSFLSVVLGPLTTVPTHSQAWAWSAAIFPDSTVQTLGYVEKRPAIGMPTRGEAPEVPYRQVARPDFSLPPGIGSVTEVTPPHDIGDLWATFSNLPGDKRGQFLRAAAKWQEALMFWSDRRTLSFALMVVACEALKPSADEYYSHNVYEVVQALVGKPSADLLREPGFQAQDVRSAHLHAGEFRSSEFLVQTMAEPFYDPTFDQAARALGEVTRATIIEWLRRRGEYTMPPLAPKAAKRRKRKTE
jgi:hypothetical protein